MDWNILDTNHQHLLIDSYDLHFPDKIFTFKMVLIENKRHQKGRQSVLGVNLGQ